MGDEGRRVKNVETKLLSVAPVFWPCWLIKQTDPLATASDGGLLARMRVLASPCPQRTQYRARGRL